MLPLPNPAPKPLRHGTIADATLTDILYRRFANRLYGAGGTNGVIIAQGGRFGGWSVYAEDGKLKFFTNVLGIHEFPTVAGETIPKGRHQVRMKFAYDGARASTGL